MSNIANDALPVLVLFQAAFSSSVFARAQLLAVAAILTTGRRTVSNLLRTVGCLVDGAPSSYHRVLSESHFSGLHLSYLLLAFLLQRFYPSATILLVGDDTVTEHPGKHVYGKGRHRDAVRSSHTYTAFRWGHKWVTLAILVHFPFTRRPWALPVLSALYRSPQDNKKRSWPHKTPAQLMQLLLRIVLRWFPDRQFSFAGDAGFGSHEMAQSTQRHQGRLSLVSKFPANANLYAPPPPYSGKGRPPKKGKKMPSPNQVVADGAKRTCLNVSWYGGTRRDVEVVSEVGWWFKSGMGLVCVRWVYVHDLSGTHRDDYLYSTDVNLSTEQIIERYTQRWNIETTFEEMRSYLGLETTQGYCQKTVQRAEPMLFGLYTVIALLYEQLPEAMQEQGQVQWEGKQTVTFSDAISSVRRWLWTDWVFQKGSDEAAFSKLPLPLRQTLLSALAPAA
jgi:hypothetical protein